MSLNIQIYNFIKASEGWTTKCSILKYVFSLLILKHYNIFKDFENNNEEEINFYKLAFERELNRDRSCLSHF